PLHRVVEHRVQAGSGYAVYFSGLGVANPKFDRLGSDIREGESFPVRRPHGLARARARRKRDMNLRGMILFDIGNVHQVEARGTRRDTVPAGSVMLAVILGL